MMMRTKAPLRVSFAGGGTDVQPYATDYGGYILSAAINLYARACYDSGEQHTPQNDMEGLLFKMMPVGVCITSDVHPASGLGGSSTCLVAGLKTLYPGLDAEQIARLAFYLERNAMKVPGGIQDQYCAAFGGMLFLTIEGDKNYVERLDCTDDLARFMVLVYTGERRVPGESIILDQNAHYNLRALHRQKQAARQMKECVLSGDWLGFGKLLGESWAAKREMSALVTTPEIDELHKYCTQNGAVSGCIMGAGAGGYMLFIEHPDKEGELRQALVRKGIEYMNICFDKEGVRLTMKGD